MVRRGVSRVFPKADLAQFDAQAILSPAGQDAALQTDLPYGQPACPRLLPQSTSSATIR